MEADLRNGLYRLAAGWILSDGPSVGEGVRLAEQLLAAGFDGPATVEVASLPHDATLRDSEPLLRAMLAEHEIWSGEMTDRYAMLLRAFGFSDLPIHLFEGAFYSRLPHWDEQGPLDRALVVMFNERNHEANPERRLQMEARIRAEVRKSAEREGRKG